MSVRDSQPRPLGKYFAIRSRLKPDLVLEVKDGRDKPGTSVVVNEEGPSTASQDHQLWFYDSETTTIRSKMNQFCLDITENGSSELVVQPHLSQSSSQKWIFYEDRIQTEEDFEMVVSVAETSLQSPVTVQSNNEADVGQRWSFDCKPAPFFYIRSYQSMKVLDVRGADPKPGAKLIIYEAKGDIADNQLWYEDQSGIIRSKLNGFAIDASGKDIVMSPYEKSKEWQQWIVNGNSLQNRSSPRHVLELKPAKFRSDATVFLSEQTIFNPMQFWTFDQVSDSSSSHSGNGKHFIIRSRLAGLVLETKDRLASAGSLVVTGFRDEIGSRSSANQLFFVDEVTGTIRTCVNNYCLDLQDGDDGHLILNPYDPYRKTQQWRITGKKIFCRQHADLILTLNSGDAKKPGITVSALKDQNTDRQLWDITYQPAKCFYITSQLNGKVLDVKSSDPSPGTKVIMYDRKGEMADNQLWYEDENGVLRSKLNGFVMEAPAEKHESIRLKPFNPTNNNHYWIVVGDRIQNKYDNGVVLDIRGESKKNRASLCAYKFTGGENQRWTFEYI